MDITNRMIQANTIRLHVALAGDPHNDPVILLHGFPDASFGWERQIPALTKAGFYVIAPDQRGYYLSDKPKSLASYHMDFLVADVLALADELGLGRFHLAGHDFGALVSWYLADQHPDRLRRLAILNVPHPAVLRETLATDREQRQKSWYAYFFRLPALPELVFKVLRYRVLSAALCQSLSPDEVERYRQAWAQPGAMTAMINWYRCVPRWLPSSRFIQPVAIPTLMIWGKRDPHLKWQMAPKSIARCTQGRLELIEDASHWVHQDQPERVNRLLAEHFHEK